MLISIIVYNVTLDILYKDLKELVFHVMNIIVNTVNVIKKLTLYKIINTK
jgi:hypothetical protein